MDRRLGSNKDAIDIRETFQSLGFQVYTYQDCTCDQIRYYLSNLRQQNVQNDNSCLFIFILSHGYKNGIYGVNENRISFVELQTCLITNSGHLNSITPTVMLFQSCRDGERSSNKEIHYPKPISDHFLLVFATQDNCRAYRDCEEGSLFIQCFLRAINEDIQESNILNILTHTNSLLAEWNKHKQRLEYNSLLLLNLQLPRYNIMSH